MAQSFGFYLRPYLSPRMLCWPELTSKISPPHRWQSVMATINKLSIDMRKSIRFGSGHLKDEFNKGAAITAIVTSVFPLEARMTMVKERKEARRAIMTQPPSDIDIAGHHLVYNVSDVSLSLPVPSSKH